MNGETNICAVIFTGLCLCAHKYCNNDTHKLVDSMVSRVQVFRTQFSWISDTLLRFDAIHISVITVITINTHPSAHAHGPSKTFNVVFYTFACNNKPNKIITQDWHSFFFLFVYNSCISTCLYEYVCQDI